VRLYIGLTDYDWFSLLRDQRSDEVNFWRPSGRVGFKALQPDEPFLFKSKTSDTGIPSPGFIMGGGFFARFVQASVSMAWEAFEQKNGVTDITAFLSRIRTLGGDQSSLDPTIGCVLLNEPFYFPRELWVPAPANWPVSTQVGKGYELSDPVAARLWDAVAERMSDPRAILGPNAADVPGLPHPSTPLFPQGERRLGSEYLTSSRLGQGAFRLSVLDAYETRCAATGERVRPVLEAAHIKPFSMDGPNAVSNGLSLRSDIHKLFDQGYVTVDRGYRIRVSSLLQKEFHNGRDYYRLEGQRLAVLPQRLADRPGSEYLEWHNDAVFRP